MAALRDLFSFRPALARGLRERADRWRALPAADLTRPVNRARYVVLDVETTGLDPHRDRLLSLGAVAVEGARLCLGELFHCIVRQEIASERGNILIHGIGPTAQAEGEPPEQALLAFLDFAGKDPLVAFHAPFDREVLRRALRVHLAIRRPPHAWLDLAWLLPALFPEAQLRRASLDAWLAHFGLRAHARHTADADALATAELLLLALKRGQGKGVADFRSLCALARAEAHLAPGGGFGGA